MVKLDAVCSNAAESKLRFHLLEPCVGIFRQERRQLDSNSSYSWFAVVIDCWVVHNQKTTKLSSFAVGLTNIADR